MPASLPDHSDDLMSRGLAASPTATVLGSDGEQPPEAFFKTGKDGSAAVVVVFRAADNARQFQKKPAKFLVKIDHHFLHVIEFLHEKLGYTPAGSERLFLFVNGNFQPHPDETVDNLFRCFHVGGKLMISYALTKAWG